MEHVKITLCPGCGQCPSVEIDDTSVRIEENGSAVTLSHAAWNDLVALIRAAN
jgi:hypothetical protein